MGPAGEIVPDIEARLPGRGLWLTPRRDIVERAVAKRAFARAARRPVAVAPELADRVESLLARRAVDLLGLARRAALAVAGFDRVNEAIRQDRAALLLSAVDGASAGIRKLAGAGRDLRAASVLTSIELGAAFGRERIVHAAVAGGPLCERLWQDLSRLAGLRPTAVSATASEHGFAPGIDRGIDLAPARPAQQNGGTEAHD